MTTSTEPEGAPPAAKGTKREANRKRSSEQGEGGQGGAGSIGGGGWQKRKKKEVFIYGNYKNYYGYRVSAKPLPFVLFPGTATLQSVFTRGRQLFDDMPHSRFRCSWGLGISVQLGCFGLTHDPEKVKLTSLSA